MCYGTLVGRCVTFSMLGCALAVPARAQNAADPAGAFCALAGLDLLAALDGSWTIRQEKGTAQAGMMTIPLPAPPPTQVTFRFDPPRRVINVLSKSLADDIIMFPAAPIQQDDAARLVGDSPPDNPTVPVCAWLEAPTIIGTNVYFLMEDDFVLLLNPHITAEECDRYQEAIGDSATHHAVRPGYQKIWDMNCRKPPIEPNLDMAMTLALRFTSANSGAGMVYFTGKTDRSAFRASAPVRLSR
jgi:hypothetical protein